MPEVIPWDRFSSDPRSADHAPLRASDLDRNVALDVLASAYADGRLTREEHDERTATVSGAKTLGELVAPIRDLAPATRSLVTSNQEQLQAKAEDRYLQRRTQALTGFLVPSIICWVIWATVLLAGGGTPFPWPVFVSLGTGMGLVRTLSERRAIIEKEKRRIERAELRAIERKPR